MGWLHGHRWHCPAVSVDQFRPWTFQGTLDTQNRGKQQVYFTRLDFLKAAQMQIGEFGKPLLCQVFCVTFPAQICAEPLDVNPVFTRQWHALLRRNCNLTDTPYSA